MPPTTGSFNKEIFLNSHSSDSTLTFEYSCQGEKLNTNITSMDDGTKCHTISEVVSPLYDTDGFANGPNLLSVENLTSQDAPLANFNDLVDNPSQQVWWIQIRKFDKHWGMLILRILKNLFSLLIWLIHPKIY